MPPPPVLSNQDIRIRIHSTKNLVEQRIINYVSIQEGRKNFVIVAKDTVYSGNKVEKTIRKLVESCLIAVEMGILELGIE